jgi:hypothetical protein
MIEFKAHVIPEAHAFRTSVYLTRQFGEQIEFVYFEDGKIRFEKHTGNQPIQVPPTFSIPSNLANPILTALASAITIAGVENKSESHLAGELEATKKHLEDMRLLAKVK